MFSLYNIFLFTRPTYKLTIDNSYIIEGKLSIHLILVIIGVEIPNTQPLMKIQNSDYLYPGTTLPLNKCGHYPNIISK